MANRRMFSKEIIDSDMFLDMPLSTQALYFHLSMRADDDGFVNNPKKIARMVGSSDDDAKLLLAKNFILDFDSGVIVIKHWKIHNYIQKDRYKKTNYTEEMGLLTEKENGVYTLDTECIQNGDSGKVRKELGKVRKEKDITVVNEDEELAKKTIAYINSKTRKRFGNGVGNLKEIKAQINKLKANGDTLKEIEDKFAYVVNVKCQEWLNNTEYKKHLNPVTLFRESNFDKYLNQDMKVNALDMVDAIYEAKANHE